MRKSSSRQVVLGETVVSKQEPVGELHVWEFGNGMSPVFRMVLATPLIVV